MFNNIKNRIHTDVRISNCGINALIAFRFEFDQEIHLFIIAHFHVDSQQYGLIALNVFNHIVFKSA